MTTAYSVGDINSNAKGTGARASGGKCALSLIPFHLLAGTARVLMGGRLKYKEWNWTKGMPWSECYNCLLRHLFKWWYLGEECDHESGENHLDHAMCNLLFLMHFQQTFKEGDDRPPQELTRFRMSLPDFNKKFDEGEYRARLESLKAGFLGAVK